MRKFIINISRFVVALVFIFSGFVKAVDPMGGAYKIQDYVSASFLSGLSFPQWILIGGAIVLSSIEFLLGIFMFFGYHRRLTSYALTAILLLMTTLTFWIWNANPVKDCGCFGDAVVLENGITLLKNVILLALSILITIYYKDIFRILSKQTQWIVSNYSGLFIIGVCFIALYDLPIIDFRPYHIGANFQKDIDIPEGAEQPVYETTFVLEKDGKQKEFTLDNYPDSSWTFVDSKTTLVSEGYVPPMHDFSIEDHASGNDLTDSIAKRKGFTYLLIAPDLLTASDANFGDIDRIYEFATTHKQLFCCLTASNTSAKLAWQDKTGAEYPFYFSDYTTLKTIIRSNPGLLLLHDGVIIGKWSHNVLPSNQRLKELTNHSQKNNAIHNSMPKRAMSIILWFVVPLLLLTLADRLWAWSKWVKGLSKKKK